MKVFATVLTVLIAATATFGANAPEVSFVPIPAEKKFSLSINNLKEAAHIRLQDEEGVILLEERVQKKGSYSKVYNLSNLPEATYYMSVRTRTKKTVQPIKLTEQGVDVDVSKRKHFFGPVIRSTNDHVDLSLYNGKIADVKVSILDAGRDVVYEEALENVLVVQKRYSTKKLKWGNYIMLVETANDIYQHEFEVR
ncbi:MAG: hypothetical protein GVY26_16160 [Bacteroidetes bacterium]|nr:hypothetical protein [Bacteroidota bacterium]